MPSLPKGRRNKRPRSKAQYKKDGSVNWKARVPFHGWDPEYHDLYQTSRWQKIRQKILGRGPTCDICMCQHKVLPATDVDHIFPHRGNPGDFYDLDNMWSICRRHHMQKTALESNGVEYRTKEEWIQAILDLDD